MDIMHIQEKIAIVSGRPADKWSPRGHSPWWWCERGEGASKRVAWEIRSACQSSNTLKGGEARRGAKDHEGTGRNKSKNLMPPLPPCSFLSVNYWLFILEWILFICESPSVELKKKNPFFFTITVMLFFQK